MKLFRICAVLTTIFILSVSTTELDIKKEMAMAGHMKNLQEFQLADMTYLKKNIQEFKDKAESHEVSNDLSNEKSSLDPAKTLGQDITEMRDITTFFRQLYSTRNQLLRVLQEDADLNKLAHSQATKISLLESEINHLKLKDQQLETVIAELRSYVDKLHKELKSQQIQEPVNYIDMLDTPDDENIRRLRHHNKITHKQIIRLSRCQDRLDHCQDKLQTQVTDMQRRFDHFKQSNWITLSNKVEYIEKEIKISRSDLRNVSQKISDFDKIHACMLELREDVEGIENKVDNMIPELRKEISKLDIGFAQINAQSSYLKDDQDNLRQSVKAIAVSISNTIDHAEMDRLLVKKINESITELTAISKQHQYRLNDHIFKSEINKNFDTKETSSMNELMVEVKDLQSAKQQYENLSRLLPKDCSSISGPEGVYLIRPGQVPLDTWCVNGSTLLQRRYNGSIEFNRKFTEYAQGFGDAASEYWIGLEAMHHLTINNCSSLRIDMTDIFGGKFYAQYEYFSVGSPDTGYILNIGGFEGNASDALKYQNNMEFSTIDRDRDISNINCAKNYEGGWWFSHCQHVNINGKYSLGLTWFDSVRNEWIALATSEMRLYRRPECH